MDITLSYVLTTFNKLQYLRVTVPYLIENCQPDEEIVIIDGGSTDGTVDFLRKLYEEGKIHQFVSEKDQGEAHGTNKALLMAKGSLIKIITDDDVYSFESIRKCKQFLLENNDVDVLASDGLGFYVTAPANQRTQFRQLGFQGFKKWQEDKTPFFFTGLSLLIRRSSIPLVGIFDTNYLIVDFEFSLRVTSGKGKIAWFSGVCFANIVNANSNSSKYWHRLHQEKIKLGKIYGGETRFRLQYWYSLSRLRLSLAARKILPSLLKSHPAERFEDIFQETRESVVQHNSRYAGEFYK